MASESLCDILKNAKKVMSKREGTVIEDGNCVRIISKNMIDGKSIECQCSVSPLNCKEFPYCVDAYEKTYSVIGGVGVPCKNEEEIRDELEKILDRFCFVPRTQMTLFDLVC